MARGAAVHLEVGDRFAGRYEVLSELGRGGMGAVYEVLDDNTQRRRALKVMLPKVVANAQLRSRFRREATVAAAIESDHIAEVLDAGVDEAAGMPFIVLELLRGQELAAMLQERGPLAADEVVTYLGQAAMALDKAHAAGIVHRDLKPENLFITYADDGSPRLKVLDFGIAKVVSDSTTGPESRGLMGTPVYMAPEQIHREVPLSGRTDGYALAHIAYALLVGEPYFTPECSGEGGVYGLIVALAKGAPEPASQRAQSRAGIMLPAGFDAWFSMAAALQPQDRYADVLELVDALAEVVEGEGVADTLIESGADTLLDSRHPAPTPYPVQPSSAVVPSSAQLRANAPASPTSVASRAAVPAPSSAAPLSRANEQTASTAAVSAKNNENMLGPTPVGPTKVSAGVVQRTLLQEPHTTQPGAPSPELPSTVSPAMAIPPSAASSAAVPSATAMPAATSVPSPAAVPAATSATSPAAVPTPAVVPAATSATSPAVMPPAPRARRRWWLVAGVLAAAAALYGVSRAFLAAPTDTSASNAPSPSNESSSATAMPGERARSSQAPPTASPSAARMQADDRNAAGPAPLTGQWVSASGRNYRVVYEDGAYRFLIDDPAQFQDQGYRKDEPRFELTPIQGNANEFMVTDHLRPFPVDGAHYDSTQSRASCIHYYTAIAGEPLRAVLRDNELTVTMTKVAPTAANYVVRNGQVIGCRDLHRATVRSTQSTLWRRKGVP